MERYHSMKKIELKKIFDPRGSLTVVEQGKELPFEIGSVRWLYGTSTDATHTMKGCQHSHLVVALSGSFQVTSLDTPHPTCLLLNHPYQGLLIEAGTNYTITDFSYGSVCLLIESK